MKYPEVRNYVDGAFVGAAGAFLDVHNPSDGSVISRVPLSTQDDVDTAVVERRKGVPGLVGDADQGARAGLLPLQDAAREEHRRARRAGHRGERQDRQRGAGRGAQVGRAERVRLLAAADRAGRSARGEPRRRVPDRALSRSASSPRSRRSTSRTWCRTGRFPTRSRSATA